MLRPSMDSGTIPHTVDMDEDGEDAFVLPWGSSSLKDWFCWPPAVGIFASENHAVQSSESCEKTGGKLACESCENQLYCRTGVPWCNACWHLIIWRRSTGVPSPYYESSQNVHHPILQCCCWGSHLWPKNILESSWLISKLGTLIITQHFVVLIEGLRQLCILRKMTLVVFKIYTNTDVRGDIST